MLNIIKPDLDTYTAKQLIEYFKDPYTEPDFQKYSSVPDFMIKDVFNAYYGREDETIYETSEGMHWWYKMLLQLKNYLLKVGTENKEGYSFIATKHIVEILREILDEEQNKDPNRQPGDEPSKDHSKKIADRMKSATQNIIQEIEKCQKSEDLLGTKPGKNINDVIESGPRIKMLENVLINKKSIDKLINKTIKNVKTGFSSKSFVVEENILDADQYDDMMDEYMLANNAMIPDMSVQERKQKNILFDLYIDVSGSMRSSIYVNNRPVERLKLAQTLALKMQQLNCLNNLYSFNTNLRSYEKNYDELWCLDARGGTNITKVIENITATKNPSVILTDADDRIHAYDDNAFVISIVENDNMDYRITDSVKKMLKNKKYLLYKSGSIVIPKINA